MLFSNIYKNKTVLVTGHNGFKGAWLSLWLKNLGAKVTGISIENLEEKSFFKVNGISDLVEDLNLDIRNLDSIKHLIKQLEPDFVFHLAAQALVRRSYRDPLETWSTNLVGTLNILESLRSLEKKCACILITSDKCYSNKEWAWGYRENDTLGGPDPYSASKACAELAIKSYVKSFFNNKKNALVKISSARAGNVIGGGDWSENRIIPDAIKSIKNKKKFYLRNPLSTRPWQHVLEPISGYLKLGYYLSIKPKSFSQSWNFGPKGNQIKNVRNLIKILSSNLYPFKLKVFHSKNKKIKEAKLLKLNSQKAFELLKWKCKWNMEQAIEKTAFWYKAFLLNEDTKKLIKKQIREYFNKP